MFPNTSNLLTLIRSTLLKFRFLSRNDVLTLDLLEVMISKYIQLLVKDDHQLDDPGKKVPVKTKGTKMTVTT